MVSTSAIRGPRRDHPLLCAFTLLEVMLATVISGIVFSGVLSAYIFLGRGLTRQGNEEVMESRSRLALFYFTQDVSSATTVDPTNMTSTQMSLYSPDQFDEVIYTYDQLGGTLTRTTTGTAPGPASLTLLIGLTTLTFNYYSFVPTTTPTPPPLPPPAAVKQINMAFTTVAGLSVSGAQSQLEVTSPRVTLKNKPLLGAPPLL